MEESSEADGAAVAGLRAADRGHADPLQFPRIVGIGVERYIPRGGGVVARRLDPAIASVAGQVHRSRARYTAVGYEPCSGLCAWVQVALNDARCNTLLDSSVHLSLPGV